MIRTTHVHCREGLGGDKVLSVVIVSQCPIIQTFHKIVPALQ